MYTIWTEEEKEFVQKNAGFLKDKDLANQLYQNFGVYRKLVSVRKMRQRLGIKKANGRGICQVEN